RGVGAQHAAPLRALSGYTTRIVNPTLPARPPLPGLRLPLGRRRLGPGATLAVFVHAVIVGVLVVGGREIMGRGQGGSRAGGGGGRGGGGRGGGGRAAGRRAEPAWGLERETKRVTFSPPRRGRPMCRPSARFPARWPVAPTA